VEGGLYYLLLTVVWWVGLPPDLLCCSGLQLLLVEGCVPYPLK